MIVSPDPFLDECFIKKPYKKQDIKEDIKEENHIQDSEALNLENLINESVKDLSKNNETNISKNIDKTITNKSSDPIDLEISFDENLQNNKSIINENINSNTFDLEEVNIEISNLQDVEELESKEENQEDPTILKEIDLSSTIDNSLETFKLKKPNQVYYEIYKKAREKAKEAKKNAILAYLEMKNIKKTYMLDDIDESDSEFEEYTSRDGSSEISDTECLEDNF